MWTRERFSCGKGFVLVWTGECKGLFPKRPMARRDLGNHLIPCLGDGETEVQKDSCVNISIIFKRTPEVSAHSDSANCSRAEFEYTPNFGHLVQFLSSSRRVQNWK